MYKAMKFLLIVSIWTVIVMKEASSFVTSDINWGRVKGMSDFVSSSSAKVALIRETTDRSEMVDLSTPEVTVTRESGVNNEVRMTPTH